MESITSLAKVTKKLLTANTDFDRLKVLLNLESRVLPARELLRPDTVSHFLNSLVINEGDYVKFVKGHVAYFLLRIASFQDHAHTTEADGQETPPQTDPGGDREREGRLLLRWGDRAPRTRLARDLHTLARLWDTLSSASADALPTECVHNNIQNKAVLDNIQIFIQQLADWRPEDKPPVADNVLRTFACVEELTHEVYLTHWQSLTHFDFSAEFKDAHAREPVSHLHRWLVANYYAQLYSPDDATAAYDIQKLAADLVIEHQELFITPPNFSESAFALPASKTRALEILQAYIAPRADAGAIHSKNGESFEPGLFLTFGDAELDSAPSAHLFLLDFVAEALCHCQSYACSDRAVEDFLTRAVHSLRLLGDTIQTQCANASFSRRRVIRTHHALLRAGLSETNCARFSAIMLMSPTRPRPDEEAAGHASSGSPFRDACAKWPHFEEFIQLVHQITLFASYFYLCLRHCSPTSIGFRETAPILQQAEIEQSPEAARNRVHALAWLLPWTLADVLRIFLPSPPMPIFNEVSRQLSSDLVRSFFWINVKRNWGVSFAPDVIPKDRALAPVPASITEEQVEKYCTCLNIGDTIFNPAFTTHPHFVPAFIKSTVYPTLYKILTNNLQRNRALFYLRWLITFAAEDSPGLERIRRPLTLAYFQMVDIGSLKDSEKTAGSFADILDYLHEVFRIIHDVVPDATFPNNLPSFLFTLHYTPRTRKLLADAHRFAAAARPILRTLTRLLRVGSALCHSDVTYEAETRTVTLPVSDDAQSFSLPVEGLRTAAEVLEKTCAGALVALNQLTHDLHASYVELLALVGEIEHVAKHVIKINHGEPDVSVVTSTYLACFTQARRAVDLVTTSCCYSLTKHFRTIFEPELLPLSTTHAILEFSEERGDRPNTFLQSLEQPLEMAHRPAQHAQRPPLTPSDVDVLSDLIPDLLDRAPSPRSTQAIKKQYTDTYDVIQISLDWNTHDHTVYVTAPVTLSYRIVTKPQLMREMLQDA
ncbi:tegument protein UL37 [Common bottlenose dolphin gammaherpesvirus 1 strain Sarasota]|uniref:Tegument protein UL37 n=1 Tax=Common bottlenose dolphin gammaherpesvirus 1 strain Sarasota TaxID=2022783 RepID=A0A1Z1NEK2_9GAMA|nr:tegument protein UL37 [Common bottlenose dolphin gammaherpesvirus 1 strain Sarasota]ARW78125.1 tegument protein UL37 [Common bottlenose dolphin gammaherpesvirus 1 strain Sarasota]